MTTTKTTRRELVEESERRAAAKAEKEARLLRWVRENPGEPIARAAEACGMARWWAGNVVRRAKLTAPPVAR